jgi:hypothetical protein
MNILFTADFEDRTSNAFDNVAVSGLASCSVQRSIVHSGQYAAKLTVLPFFLAAQPGVRLVWYNKAWTTPDEARNLPDAAYYSAWYYLPPVETPWLNIMQWKQGRMTSETRQARDPVAFVKVQGEQGRLSLSLQHRVSARGTYEPTAQQLAESDILVPVNEWFELTTFYRWDKGLDGYIASWLNGVPLWEVQGIQTEYDQPFTEYPREVTFNNYAAAVKPSPYSLYIDDVKVWVE